VKAAAFDILLPVSLNEAIAAGGNFIAGGQSLGPMLNLRVIRPETLVAIGKLAELRGVADKTDAITIGAAVTHAQIADGLLPPLGPGPLGAHLLPSIAEGIAYRAVRNRGTIGGSLCHADPAADWLCTLAALGASVLTAPTNRLIAVEDFCAGAYRNRLVAGELVAAIRIPKISAAARWGYVKFCRKPGEFAHAMAAVLLDGAPRAAIGALGGPPLVLVGKDVFHPEARLQEAATGLDDQALRQQQIALARAVDIAQS
jgi:carbon-monoxide dehydrogenase medium subunit